MPTATERLDALERENADLRARLAAVEGAKPAPQSMPPPGDSRALSDPRYAQGAPYVAPGGPSVIIVQPPAGPMPTDAELRRLYAIVGASHPTLAPSLDGIRHEADRHAALTRFANAFRAVGRLGRADKLDHTRALSWWTDYAQSLCEPGTGQNDFHEGDFWAAALARGVPYRAWSVSSGVEFALTWAGAGGRVGDVWRKILVDARINPPADGVHQHPDCQAGRYHGPTYLR